MSAARTLTFVGIGLTAAALGVGFWVGDEPRWIAFAALAALVWMVGEWQGAGWTTTVAFVLVVAMAVLGVMLGCPAAWMGAAVAIGVSAWSLGDFTRRAAPLVRVEDRARLVRRYFIRLLMVIGGSVALSAIALTVTLRLSFIPVLVLGALLAFGLIQVISALRSAGR